MSTISTMIEKNKVEKNWKSWFWPFLSRMIREAHGRYKNLKGIGPYKRILEEDSRRACKDLRAREFLLHPRNSKAPSGQSRGTDEKRKRRKSCQTRGRIVVDLVGHGKVSIQAIRCGKPLEGPEPRSEISLLTL